MTVFGSWQRVTLDSIRNSCDVNLSSMISIMIFKTYFDITVALLTHSTLLHRRPTVRKSDNFLWKRKMENKQKRLIRYFTAHLQDDLEWSTVYAGSNPTRHGGKPAPPCQHQIFTSRSGSGYKIRNRDHNQYQDHTWYLSFSPQAQFYGSNFLHTKVCKSRQNRFCNKTTQIAKNSKKCNKNIISPHYRLSSHFSGGECFPHDNL